MYLEYMTMDAAYNPINNTTTNVPNLGNVGWENKTQSMHPKYNIMHEFWTIEETEFMLSFDATSSYRKILQCFQ